MVLSFNEGLIKIESEIIAWLKVENNYFPHRNTLYEKFFNGISKGFIINLRSTKYQF